MTAAPAPIPTHEVLDWAAFKGPTASPVPTLLKRRDVCSTSSGRGAILLALEALGVGPGQLVLLPTYHCPTMVSPVVARGAEPVFYPPDESGAPQLDWLDRAPLCGVRALVAAHFFDLPQPMRELRAWCDRHGIALIEDCAHALFGISDSRPVGAWGDLAIASVWKFLPAPEGGCLLANRTPPSPLPTPTPPSMRDELKAALDVVEASTRCDRLPGLNTLVRQMLGLFRRLRGGKRPQAEASDGEAAAAVTGATPDTPPLDIARAHRRSTRITRLLATRLPLAGVVEGRRRRYAELARRFEGQPGLRPLAGALPPACVPYVFPLWVDTPDPAYAELRRRGLPVFRWNWRWPGVPDIEGDTGRQWASHVLQLPCHQALSDDDVERIASTVIELFASAGIAAPPPASPPQR